MTDVWKPTKRWKFWELEGAQDTFVCIVPTPGKGFLWTCRNRYGFGETLADAARWAEALADHFSIPADKRWMTL